jgi:hypothetical protein
MGGGRGAMTTGERTAQIDHELDASFGVFDGRIRDEQAVIAQQRGGSGGGTSDIGGDSDSERAGGSDGAGEGGEAGQNGQGGNGAGDGTGDQPGQSEGRSGGGGGYGGGAGGGSGPNTVPADIPDGSDDDIVARQLREAAMKETDAELREKLWQEYRAYKKGT